MPLIEESACGLPWDPLREQDWNSLGVLGDESVMESALWDGAGDGVVGHGTDHHGCDGLEVDESGMPCKVSSQFSPMTIDAQFDCFWDNFPGDGLQVVDAGSQDDGHNPSSQAKGVMEAKPEGAGTDKDDGRQPSASATQQAHQGGHAAMSDGRATQIARNNTAPSLGDGTFMGLQSHMMGGMEGMEGASFDSTTRQSVIATPFAAHGEYQIRVKDKEMFLIPLAVVAVTDGILMQDIAPHLRTTLEQIQRKMSKDNMTAMQVRANDGSLVDLRVRAFPVASSEAAAINDYIAANPSQAPAPFLVLHAHLDVGVAYDVMALDPSVASGADRLRKKIKAHAIKTLREALGDGRCRVSAACLAGMHGAMAAAPHLRFMVDEKMTTMDEGMLAAPLGFPGRRILVVPTKKPRAPREEGKNLVQLPVSISGACYTANGRPTHRAGFPGSTALHSHMNGASGTRVHYSPDASQPSTPGGHMDDDGNILAGEGQRGPTPHLTAYFPVNLFVTAIADGQIASDTPNKVAERLGLIVRKVPKEQNTSVEIADAAGTVPLQMRVFVVNSEDAKAVGDYINGHMDQVILLVQTLPDSGSHHFLVRIPLGRRNLMSPLKALRVGSDDGGVLRLPCYLRRRSRLHLLF